MADNIESREEDGLTLSGKWYQNRIVEDNVLSPDKVLDSNPYNHPSRVDPLKPEATPKIGFRSVVNKMGIKLAPSKKELAMRERAYLINRREAENWSLINRPLNRTNGYCCFITVGSEKGGVGKTTVTAGLAYTFARERQDKIVVADANPDRGSLPARMGVVCKSTLKDLARNVADIPTRRSLGEFLAKVPGVGISVLGGETDARRRDSTTAQDIKEITEAFKPFFSIGILDNGTGISHSAMDGSMAVSHSMALVIDNTQDAFDFVKSTLVYLEETGMDDLRDRVVLVICNKILTPEEEGGKKIDTVDPDEKDGPTSHTWKQYANVTADDIEKQFEGAVRETIVIPYDPALAKSGPINFDDLNIRTRRAFQSLAAVLSDDFIQ